MKRNMGSQVLHSQSNLMLKSPNTPNKSGLELYSLHHTPMYRQGTERSLFSQQKPQEVGTGPAQSAELSQTQGYSLLESVAQSRTMGRYQRTAAFFKELSSQPKPATQGTSPARAAGREYFKPKDSGSLNFEGFRFDSSQQNSRAGSQRASVIQQQAHLLNSNDMRLMKRRLNEDSSKEVIAHKGNTKHEGEAKHSYVWPTQTNQYGLPRDSSGGNSVGVSPADNHAQRTGPALTRTRPVANAPRQESQSDMSVSLVSPSMDQIDKRHSVKDPLLDYQKSVQRQAIGVSRPDHTRSFHQPNKLIEQLITKPPGSMGAFPTRQGSPGKERSGSQKDHEDRHAVTKSSVNLSGRDGKSSRQPNPVERELGDQAPLTLRNLHTQGTVETTKPDIQGCEASIVFANKPTGKVEDSSFLLEKVLLEAEVRAMDSEIEEENRRILELRNILDDLRSAQEDQIRAKEKEANYFRKKYSGSKQVLEKQLADEFRGFSEIYESLKAAAQQ